MEPIMIRHRDTKFTKLFVGGIPYDSDDEALRSFFSQFGEIEEAVVIKDRVTKKSKGYGFVTMATSDAAELACKNKRPMIEGRQANVNLAYLGAKPKPAKIMKSPPGSPYSYPSTISVGSPQQYAYPVYNPSQSGSPHCHSPISTVLSPGPQSPNGQLGPGATMQYQPLYVDYGGGTFIVLNPVYDPYYYSPTQSYVQPMAHSPPAASSPNQAFTFPTVLPPTPTLNSMNALNTQQFFPAPYEIIAQPQVQ